MGNRRLLAETESFGLSMLQGKAKYVFKQRLFVSDVGVSDVHEGASDECKFAIWNNRSHSLAEGKIILKVGRLSFLSFSSNFIHP